MQLLIRWDYVCICMTVYYVQLYSMYWHIIDHIHNSDLRNARHAPDLGEPNHCVSRGVFILERKYGFLRNLCQRVCNSNLDTPENLNCRCTRLSYEYTVFRDKTHILVRILFQSLVTICGNNRLLPYLAFFNIQSPFFSFCLYRRNIFLSWIMRV